MTVTIIMPVYNDPEVKRAVQSIINQTYGDWHLQLIDNGSTDQAVIDMIQVYAGHEQITVTRFDKNRTSEAGALIAKEVDTKYLAFLFSDDYWNRDFLQTMVEAIGNDDESPYEAIFCNPKFIDEDGVEWKKVPHTHYSEDVSAFDRAGHLRHMFHVQNTLHPCAMLIETAEYNRLGGFNPCMHKVGDMAFFARLLFRSSVAFTRQKLVNVTVHSIVSRKKNQSSDNNQITMGMMAERQMFLLEYALNANLHVFHKIFHLPPNMSPAFYLFSMGLYAIRHHAADYVLFGWRCIYESAYMDYAGMNTYIETEFGCSAGEYIKKLQERASNGR